MSKKKMVYSTEFKTKVVLEVLQGEKTLNEIAIKYNVVPKNIQNWKNTFLENAKMAMEPARAVKEYKEKNAELQKKINEYAKVVGTLTVEKEWLQGKLESLGLSDKKEFVEPKCEKISIAKQCEILGLNRSSLYYKANVNENKLKIKEHIQKIF